MTYPVNGSIPAANDLLSQSQGQIQTNFSNIVSWSGVDHVEYGAVGAGTHEQVTLLTNNVPSAPSGLASVIYSNAGTANTNASQLFYANSAITVQLSPIRAWGYITGTTITQGMNVASVTNPATGTYSVTLTSGAVASANFAVLITTVVSDNFLTAATAGYTITGTGTFNANFRGMTGPVGTSVSTFAFVVLQI